jgi:hypothetical protein
MKYIAGYDTLILGFHCGENVDCGVLGCDTTYSCNWLPTVL